MFALEVQIISPDTFHIFSSLRHNHSSKKSQRKKKVYIMYEWFLKFPPSLLENVL